MSSVFNTNEQYAEHDYQHYFDYDSKRKAADAKCRQCSKIIHRTGSSSSGMISHLQSRHIDESIKQKRADDAYKKKKKIQKDEKKAETLKRKEQKQNAGAEKRMRLAIPSDQSEPESVHGRSDFQTEQIKDEPISSDDEVNI
jgi:hypothetical protein